MSRRPQEAMVDEAPLSLRSKQAGLAEDFEMARKRVLGLPQAVHELAQARLLAGHGKQPHDPESERVRQRLKTASGSTRTT